MTNKNKQTGTTRRIKIVPKLVGSANMAKMVFQESKNKLDNANDF